MSKVLRFILLVTVFTLIFGESRPLVMKAFDELNEYSNFIKQS